MAAPAITPATAWYVQVAVREDFYSYLDVDGGFSPDGMSGEPNQPVKWFDREEDAVAACAIIDPRHRPTVGSNARY